ncbi:hypothetical protein PF003_g36679 [Phytophthora fragariae]|nr:hypothetical protein PF003_g36679 [Phytophthora fragariae]
MVSAVVTVVTHAASLRTARGRSCPRVSATVRGGARCKFEDCERQDRTNGLCYLDRGSQRCKADGYEKRTKSNGLCCGHGGGPRCKFEYCERQVLPKGLCYLYGG